MPAITSSPQHRLYLTLSGRALTVLHVRDADQGAAYFTTTVEGDTPADQQLSALLTALSSAPYRSTVYLHTSIKALWTLIRTPSPEWPRELKTLVKKQNLQLKLGSISRMDRFWQDMLALIETGKLPVLNALNNHALYTYTVTDGLHTQVAGVLYGEGQLHLCSHQLPGAALSCGELHAAHWALNVVALGKTTELHHFQPDTVRFWEETTAYLDTHPEAKTLADDIGKLVERKSLRFNLAPAGGNSPLRQAVKWVAGRALA